jgi:hypothetical protein
MTSATPPTPSADQPPNTKKINLIEVVAASLAAVSAAVAASFLGVAGTITGAAVGSVIGTVGTTVYAHSLIRGRQRWSTLRPRLTARVGTGAGQPPTNQLTLARNGTVYGRRRRRRWPLAVASTAAAFILAIGAITVAELALGHPLANLFGGQAAGRTSIGNLPGRPAPRLPGTPTPTTTTTTTDAPTGSTPPTPPATTSAVPASPTPPSGTSTPSTSPTPTEPTNPAPVHAPTA